MLHHSICREAEHALALAICAVSAYECGDRVWAGLLRAAAERCHCVILAGISRLTEKDADSLEPAVTRLERQLVTMWLVSS